MDGCIMIIKLYNLFYVGFITNYLMMHFRMKLTFFSDNW